MKLSVLRWLLSACMLSGFLMQATAQQDSSRNGNYTWYHVNGQIAIQGIYREGLRSGTWKEFNEQGEMIRKMRYKSGNIHWVYLYKEGRLIEKTDRKGRTHKMKDCGC